MRKLKILVLFSTKCAGSSAFQTYLEKNYNVKTLEHSVHFEKETLYWTKVASVLGLPQEPMHRSQIPYSPQRSNELLDSFLQKNGMVKKDRTITKEEYFEYFFLISQRTGLHIIEKSPHHLYNESNIQLIREFSEYINDRAEVYLIGLIRNPLDTIYSAWTRWGFNCRAFEREWHKSYMNLRQVGEASNMSLTIFRYEEIVSNAADLDSFISDRIGIPKQESSFSLTSGSLYRWKNNKRFCHQL
ncbi:MAG: hypothetical protein C0490_28140, partial [Marivirga sp.]|nr:hypothetical protein [Marivirga sp.]